MAGLIGVRSVPDAKLSQYLLNLVHPEGGPKARFFIARGFSLDEPGVLATALLLHAETHEVRAERAHRHGISREVVGELITPDGTNPRVKAIWVQDLGADSHRLVTAYPE